MKSLSQRMLTFLLFGMFYSLKSFAAPSIGVPNINLATSVSPPSFISLDKTNDQDQTTNQVVQQQLSNFSAQIREQILKSQMFRVVDMDNSLLADYMVSESDAVISTVETESLNAESMPKLNGKWASSIIPDYILFGRVSAINAGEELNPIINTNKYSAIYSIDLAVDYKLVRTKDKTIIAAFTAAGHAGDVKFVNSQSQKITHNMPKLVQQVGIDLAHEVGDRLNEQIGAGKLYLNSSSSESKPLVTDIKTYKD